MKDKSEKAISVFNNFKVPKGNNNDNRNTYLYRDEIKYRQYYSYIVGIDKEQFIKHRDRKCVSVFKDNIKIYHNNPI